MESAALWVNAVLGAGVQDTAHCSGQKSYGNSTAGGSVLQGSLSRDVALIEAAWESRMPSDGAMPDWNHQPWYCLELSSAFDLLADRLLFLILLKPKACSCLGNS